MRTTGVIAAVLVATTVAWAEPPVESYDLAVDVPSLLAGTDYTTSQVARRAPDATYTLAFTFPGGLAVSAVERRALNGGWLFSPTDPWTTGPDTFLPNDVVSLFNGMHTALLDGDAAGIPPSVRIDALSETADGKLEISFDVPVRLGGTDYGRSDLVRWEGGTAFVLAWSGAGVPSYANLVGSSRDAAGDRLFAFDVPVRLDQVDYFPSDLVRWSVALGFTLASRDLDNFPSSTSMRDFTTTPAVGRVATLTLAKIANHIELAWTAACGAGPSADYVVAEGTIGSWYSHTIRYCSTNGALTSAFVPPAGNWYYLVAARNGPSEGSYGTASGNVEIPPASNACAPQQLAVCP